MFASVIRQKTGLEEASSYIQICILQSSSSTNTSAERMSRSTKP
jgi:hypothetical protein